MNAIILCGGLSTRLGDITKSIPKILLEIKGKTILDYQLDKLKELGVTNVVMAAGHLSDVLFEKAGKNRAGIDLIYSIEKERLGTGGAIKFAWSHLPDEDSPVIILNGDVLIVDSLQTMRDRLRPESEGVIFGARVPDSSTYGTLVFEKNNRLLEFREKEGFNQPGYINGGAYLFTKHVRKYFPDKNSFSIEYDVFPNMKDLDVYASDAPWIDVGLPDRLAWARENWPATPSGDL